jgi:hypothetical protein
VFFNWLISTVEWGLYLGAWISKFKFGK